jgi:hypothetical protein
VVQVDKGGFSEAVAVPKATSEVVDAAIGEAVASGKVWLLSGPASLLAEQLPAGVLSPAASLRVPPTVISAAAILPENLPGAWKDDKTTALAIATALSQQAGHTLPWKTVRDVIGGALQARFLTLTPDSGPWPCELPGAQNLKITLVPASEKVVGVGGKGGGFIAGVELGGDHPHTHVLIATADFEPSEIQDLAELVPQLLAFRTKAQLPLRFQVRLEVGDGSQKPPAQAAEDLNKLLAGLKDGFQLS